MNDVESPHDEGEDEIHFREDDPQPETTPPTPITSLDMEDIIKGWEVKFEQILRCLREVQLASEKANSDMFGISREGRAREDQQKRRIEAMHVGFTEFMEKCDPAHLIGSHHLDAPTASTPYTPSTPTGLPSRLRPDFEFQPSPVGQDEKRNPRAARIREPGSTTPFETRAPGITTTFGTRAPGITTTFGTRTPEITTTSGPRASESTTMRGTRAPETFTTIEIGAEATDSTNDLHTKMIGGIAATYSEIHTIVE